MKYSTEKALSEIALRRKRITEARKRRTCRRLSVGACALFAALTMAVTSLSEHTAVASADTVYGSFLLGQEAGGYVLAAVIAFALGVTVTLLSLRWRRDREAEDPTEKVERY